MPSCPHTLSCLFLGIRLLPTQEGRQQLPSTPWRTPHARYCDPPSRLSTPSHTTLTPLPAQYHNRPHGLAPSESSEEEDAEDESPPSSRTVRVHMSPMRAFANSSEHWETPTAVLMRRLTTWRVALQTTSAPPLTLPVSPRLVKYHPTKSHNESSRCRPPWPFAYHDAPLPLPTMMRPFLCLP